MDQFVCTVCNTRCDNKHQSPIAKVCDNCHYEPPKKTAPVKHGSDIIPDPAIHALFDEMIDLYHNGV